MYINMTHHLQSAFRESLQREGHHIVKSGSRLVYTIHTLLQYSSWQGWVLIQIKVISTSTSTFNIHQYQYKYQYIFKEMYLVQVLVLFKSIQYKYQYFFREKKFVCVVFFASQFMITMAVQSFIKLFYSLILKYLEE